VAANRRAREILEVGDAPSSTCCALLGCEGGGRCICAMALGTRGTTAELCVDRPGGPLWVSATSLAGDPPHVVIALRSERRQSERAVPAPRLRVFALGRLRVECDGVPLTGEWIDQRAGQLLRCLVCERHETVPTEVLAEAIWRQAGPGAPNTVRHFIHGLRARLEPDRTRPSESSFVVSRHGGYALDRSSVWIDADDFEAEIGAGLRAASDGDDARARELLERAASAYAGDFLSDDPYAEWAMPERERLRALLAAALRCLAGMSRDDPEVACHHLERLAQLEPFDNDAARDLISAWLCLGRRSRAARYYQAFQLRLAREFGEQPDFRLLDLVPERSELAVAG
jgi:DNA-binding SARP family transcriptional activator